MEKLRNRKEWIKNAIIIFLIVMLILTFCSDSIMNMYLPEVSTESVTSGKIQESIRGTGAAELSKGYQVKLKESRTIKQINVKVGQAVKVGDVLFTLEPSDGTELDTAKSTYIELQAEYQKKLLGTDYSYDKEKLAIKNAKDDYDKAVETLNGIDGKNATITKKQAKLAKYDAKIAKYENKIIAYDTEIADLSSKTDVAMFQADLTAKQRILTTLKNELTDIEADLAALSAQGGDQAAILELERQKRDKGVEVANAQNDVTIADNEVKKANDNIKLLDSAKSNKEKATNYLNKYKVKQTTLSAEIETLKSAVPLKTDAEAMVEEKENTWNTLVLEYESKKREDNHTQETEKIELNAAKQRLIAQKKLVEDLMADSAKTEITAEQEGQVASIAAAPGDISQPDMPLAVIASDKDGFEVKVSVTKEQAAKVKAGQNATVENYWSGEIKAVVASISADAENPGSSVITFAVSGEGINEGDSVSISIGGESKMYDLVVPRSSVFEDNNGKFVLTLDSKNTPLGNRYIATRHDVEVLAQNDTKMAISTDLNGYEYVIVAASEAITPGEQVKLKE
ncbi:MAG: HlyD family efflux transporter periplasmic adaptor subunit [Lachnospiraceae bacterium]|nr:HlyD family efflux transporter periplasmic adaptor subunit [Lachnospiraceae bacterium]